MRAGVLATSFLAAGAPDAFAQAYGQWWWNAAIAAGGRQQSSSRADTEAANRSRFVRLSTDVHGYLGDPGLGSFTAGLEWELDRNDAGRATTKRSTDRLGFGFNLNALPRGKVGVNLFARRRLFDNRIDGDADAARSLLRLPESFTSWGATMRARRGRMRGLELGIRRFGFAFAPGEREDNGQEFLRFGRAGRFSHNLTLDRRTRDLAFSDVRQDQFLARFDASTRMNEQWRWAFRARSVSLDYETDTAFVRRSDEYRWFNRFTREGDRGDRWIVSVQGLGSRFDTGFEADDLLTGVQYVSRAGREWTVGPFVDYLVRRTTEGRLTAPRGGVTVSWTRATPSWDYLVSGQGSLSRNTYRNGVEARGDRNLAASASTTLGHGDRERLRKEIEAQIERRQFDIDGRDVDDLTGLVRPIDASGATDGHRLRFKLEHAWDSRSILGWVQYGRRKITDPAGGAITSDTVDGTVQFQAARFGVSGVMTGIRAVDERSGQWARFATLSGHWRPRRWIRVYGNVRVEDRAVELLPDVAGARAEAGVVVSAGLLEVDVWYSRFRRRVEDTPRTDSDALQFLLRRRFGGLLPVTTGIQRRGVIR